MTPLRQRTLFWCLAVAYLTTNYVLLGQAPYVWRWINQSIGGEGGTLMIAVYGLIGVGCVAYLARAGRRAAWTHVITLGLLLAFGAMYAAEHGSGEKVHMLQYGTLGVLLFRALRVDFGRRDPRLYVIGFTIGALAGLTDEIIQYHLPNRVFTLHDVAVNGGSSALVFLFLGVHSRENS